MGLTIKNNTKIAVMEETVEGEYEAPDSGAAFVGVTADGTEMIPAKEFVERNILNGSIGKSSPRTGTKSVSGNVGVEFKAGSTTGSAPEYSPLLNAALGAERNQASAIVTKSSGNTGNVLAIGDADIAKLAVGDIIVVKQAGAYQVSPIISKTSGSGSATVTLLTSKMGGGSYSNSVEIAPFHTYYTANNGQPTLSVSKYIEDARLETAMGCRVSSMALGGFATGQIPGLTFGFEGLSFKSELEAPAFTPSLDTSLPPIALNACVFVDGVKVDVNEITFSLENSLAFATSTCSENGRISSRIAQRTVSGTFNPYKQDDDLSFFEKFDEDTEFSIFAHAQIPTGVAGEFNQVVAFYMPKCKITELTEGDQDGNLQESISFSSNRGVNGATEEIYLTFG